ncbi:hypothetical protein O0L34_g14181 [Tuta absoluta]|nr:hypothetical protein O0L34_g14181 [Tuta absoluta]
MYDLPESTSDIAEDRKTHDIAECTKVITKITNKADCTRIKAFRLGAPKSDAGAAPRPLKVIMNSKNEALDILRNKHKLQKPSSIAADLTPMQREYLKYLREELEKRKSEGEKDLTIKYVQGRPTIVNQIKKKTKFNIIKKSKACVNCSHWKQMRSRKDTLTNTLHNHYYVHKHSIDQFKTGPIYCKSK